MAVGTYDFEVYQGDTLDKTFTWFDADSDPVDLTGYSARMHVRESVDATDAVLELSSDDGDIVLGGSAGTIQVVVSGDDMGDVEAATYRYDLELTSSGDVVQTLLKGKFKVVAEVTR